MLIHYGFYKRKPGISLEEFNYLWCEVYGRLYTETPEVTRHMRRYIQHRITPDATGNALPFDGFSEAWFESADHRAALQLEPIYIGKIKPLCDRFLDLTGPKTGVWDNPSYVVGEEPPLHRAY